MRWWRAVRNVIDSVCKLQLRVICRELQTRKAWHFRLDSCTWRGWQRWRGKHVRVWQRRWRYFITHKCWCLMLWRVGHSNRKSRLSLLPNIQENMYWNCRDVDMQNYTLCEICPGIWFPNPCANRDPLPRAPPERKLISPTQMQIW